ncbi:transketolase C-terminal domain-containing protein [Amycolatopsis anabasis]|uniref:transketolase C-terminal domain-containing protein n=1 Tax=Amycolatopsis anabasis TaxID=1840409 RepID=UPI00131D18E2|nr:transketolase C-terminal domain-containing protein [Amycolatopsis anabasis]
MAGADRIAENLNDALHHVFADYRDAYLVGEDVSDPYGGAFKVSRGLSTKYPDRVLSTPISENGLLGLCNGLALCGNRVIAEVMFGDFALLAFDQICNFAAKSVSMYGHAKAMNLVIRCPVGGHRGYGPTHSQAVHKHFLGIPDLSLFEVTPFHDNRTLLDELVNLGTPALLFEEKRLYGSRRFTGGRIDELFTFEFAGDHAVSSPGEPGPADVVLIAPGGATFTALAAARSLLLEAEIVCRVITPVRLYPFDIRPLEDLLGEARLVVVAEEGTEGGGWGAEVAHRVYERLWPRLRHRVVLVGARPSIVPTARHLEHEVLLQPERIVAATREALRG